MNTHRKAMSKTEMKKWIPFASICLFSGLCFGEWTKIDDFQSYPQGTLPEGKSNWILGAPDASTAVICADPEKKDNKAIQIRRLENTTSIEHDTLFQKNAVNIPYGTKGTVFVRFFLGDGYVSSFLVLAMDNLNASTMREGVRIDGNNAIVKGIGSSSPQDGVPLQRNSWYRLWLVVDNGSDEPKQSAAFIQEEGSSEPPVAIPGPMANRNPAMQAPGPLDVFGILKDQRWPQTEILLDDIYVDNSGQNLTLPSASTPSPETK